MPVFYIYMPCASLLTPRVRRGFELQHAATRCNTYTLSRFHFFLSPSPPLSGFFSPSHSLTYTLTHTHTHARDTRVTAWVQVLCKEGGMPLIMCVNKDGCSCLYIAAQKGHTAVVEVGAGALQHTHTHTHTSQHDINTG